MPITDCQLTNASSADNTLAQQIFAAALAHPTKRYCVFNWLNPSLSPAREPSRSSSNQRITEHCTVKSQSSDFTAALIPAASVPVPLFEEEDDGRTHRNYHGRSEKRPVHA
jgi:hypothetical protein